MLFEIGTPNAATAGTPKGSPDDLAKLQAARDIAAAELEKMPEEYTELYAPAMQVLDDLIGERKKVSKKA